MAAKVRIGLEPLGAKAELESGAPLADALVAHGVEFPCGGRGRCRGCRIRVKEGRLRETEADVARLSAGERADGWRLACQARPAGDLTLELRQWSGLILADESPFAVEPREGRGIAVDIGTTTVVAQLLDLATGRILGTRTALNPQARYGADVMSRIGMGVDGGGATLLREAIRTAIETMVEGLLAAAPPGPPLIAATLVGNTAMHHLFLGHDVTPLSRYPFEPERGGPGWLTGAQLGWPAAAANARVVFLPILGGFVGSDILAVLFATRLAEPGPAAGSADLGTNGELVVRKGAELLVTATAAGPAFEGARIAQGMRASPGAIDRVWAEDGKLRAHVIGGGAARGVCGSGLVDAVAGGLELGLVLPSGRLTAGALALRPDVAIQLKDIRELQLAKGAIAAGITMLIAEVGLAPADLTAFYLAGAFGNSLSPESANRIGLLPFPPEAVTPVGNAALLGAKIALCRADLGQAAWEELLPRVRHVSLERSPEFQERFAEAMGFPEPAGGGTAA